MFSMTETANVFIMMNGKQDADDKTHRRHFIGRLLSYQTIFSLCEAGFSGTGSACKLRSDRQQNAGVYLRFKHTPNKNIFFFRADAQKSYTRPGAFAGGFA